MKIWRAATNSSSPLCCPLTWVSIAAQLKTAAASQPLRPNSGLTVSEHVWHSQIHKFLWVNSSCQFLCIYLFYLSVATFVHKSFFQIKSPKLNLPLNKITEWYKQSDEHIVPYIPDDCIMMNINPFHQCLAAQIMTLLLMPLRHPHMSVPKATCPGE